MPNDQELVEGEQNEESQSDTGDGSGGGSDQEEGQTLSAEEEANRIQREKTLQGVVNSELDQVLKDGKNIEDVPEKFRPLVQERLDNIKQRFTAGTPDKSSIVKEVVEEIKIENLISKLPKEKQSEARNDYQDFKKLGKNTDEAISKVMKLHGILDEEDEKTEHSAYMQRSPFVKGEPSDTKGKVKISNRQAELARRFGNDPEKVYS